jgi:hypothetical protein
MEVIKEESPNEISGSPKKRIVAMHYFKDLEGPAAINALSKAIREDAKLKEELETKGHYNKYKHSFLPKQMEILKKYLGDPDD